MENNEYNSNNKYNDNGGLAHLLLLTMICLMGIISPFLIQIVFSIIQLSHNGLKRVIPSGEHLFIDNQDVILIEPSSVQNSTFKHNEEYYENNIDIADI